MAISRMQEPRQLYGLGSIVKKAVRGVKKIVKSPIGKMALLGGGAYLAGGLMGGTGGLSNFKALGTGISNGINFNEIIIHNIKSGKPNINLLGNKKKIVSKIIKKKKYSIFLSIADDKPFAIALVVISL